MKNKKGSFSLMKRMNTALILNIIKDSDGISRTDIAKKSGLTAATVTNLTAELIGLNLISEVSIGISTGGRKPVILKINSKKFFIVSAYISSNSVEVALSDLAAEIVLYKKMSFTPNDFSAEKCTDFIAESVRSFEEKSNVRILGIGLGLHGIVNTESGIWLNAPNLNLKNLDIKSMLEEKCKIRVFPENNVRLMALAEMWFGVTKDIGDFVFLYVGKGVGGAVVSGKKLVSGSCDASGEIGHMIIDMNGPLCQCGNRGCLQSLTNTDAMQSVLFKNLDKTKILTKESTSAEIIDAYLNFEDSAATEVVDEEIKYLSVGISNIINIFNPKLIVLSSRVKNFDIAVLEKLSERAAKGGVAGEVSGCMVKYSSLGERSVIKGCTAKVLGEIFENPTEFISSDDI